MAAIRTRARRFIFQLRERTRERHHELDPLSLMANWNLANTLFNARQYDRALEKCRRVLEMDPNYERAHDTLGNIYLRKGLYQKAVAELQRRAQLSEHRFWDFGRLADVYATSGDKPKTRNLLAQALQAERKEGDLHETLFARVYEPTD